jgi:energy-coupling factor transporter ATP-binding protein EcfA2
MELTELRVQNYRSLSDTGWVELDELTCLVGRNESGKTAFMRAAEKLNPAYGDGEYVPYAEYPRDEWPEYSNRHEEDPDIVASGRFRLDDDDVAAVEEAFTDGLVADREVTVHRDYANERHWELDLAEGACLEYLRASHEFAEETDEDLREAETVSGLSAEAQTAVESELGGDVVSTLAGEVGATVLAERLPGFRFVGEYSVMNGSIHVNDLLDRRENGELSPGDRVFLSLLSVAGLDLESLREVEDWRETTTELEAASAAVSEEAMDYWSQSGDISIRIQRAGTDDQPILNVRVENRDQNVTVEFEGRSHGFRRFFSTFCQLSELKRTDDDLVLLLDEPGLNLHARAKQEFLEFLKTELATKHATVYTAHSPFMIDEETVHRVRMVLADPPGGENIVGDVSLADEYTRFPLRNVFEVDLMDTLLVYPQTLLVERKADHVFLYVLSQMLRDAGKEGLDSRWTVIPVKHEANVGTFISLFGEDRLDVAALLNEMPDWKEPARGRSETESPLVDIPVKVASEYSASNDATIEDVLSTPFYLELVNGAYATAILESGTAPDRLTAEELGGNGSIVSQVESYFSSHEINGGEFDRNEPALYLQQNRAELAEELDKETRRNATRLFTDLNNILESFEGVQIRDSSFLGTLFG